MVTKGESESERDHMQPKLLTCICIFCDSKFRENRYLLRRNLCLLCCWRCPVCDFVLLFRNFLNVLLYAVSDYIGGCLCRNLPMLADIAKLIWTTWYQQIVRHSRSLKKATVFIGSSCWGLFTINVSLWLKPSCFAVIACYCLVPTFNVI